MKNFAFTLVAITVLSIGLASSAQAGTHSSHSSYSSHGSYVSHGSYGYRGSSYVSHGGYANYNVNYGTRFSQGYYYSGRNHNHWSYSRYDARYGCTCYYDPSCSSWYYWCQPASCYYPVSYCPYGTYCYGSGTCGSVGFPAGGPVSPGVQGPGGPATPAAPGGQIPTVPVNTGAVQNIAPAPMPPATN